MIIGKTPYEGAQGGEFGVYQQFTHKKTPLDYAKIHFKEELNDNAIYTSSEVRDFLGQCLKF
jgi:hypothetical protein